MAYISVYVHTCWTQDSTLLTLLSVHTRRFICFLPSACRPPPSQTAAPPPSQIVLPGCPLLG